MRSAGPSRRDVLRGGLASAAGALTVAGATGLASAERQPPSDVEISYDDAELAKYQPQLILEDVSPRPLGAYGLLARKADSSLRAAYWFVRYPYQSGVTDADSHLGDHEPLIVWYDGTTGDVERVDYAAYHWFRGTARGDALTFASGERRRPVFRADPTYHHYYLYSGELPGERIERRSLIDAIDGWLDNGLDEALATSQPYNPYAMLSRGAWWKHTAGNWLDATLKAIWYNVGLSGARDTADVEEVSVW